MNLSNIIFLSFLNTIISLNFDFLQEIERRIDFDIDPCDDFHKHVCGEPEKSLNDKLLEVYENELNVLELPDDMKYACNFSLDPNLHGQFNNIYQEDAIERMIETFRERFIFFLRTCCEKRNRTTYYTILEIIYKDLNHKKKSGKLNHYYNIQYDKNCARAAKNLKIIVQRTWFELRNERKIHNEYLKSVLRNVCAFYWLFENQQAFQRHLEMLEEMKQELLEMNKITPWISSSNSLTAMNQLINMSYLSIYVDKSFQKHAHMIKTFYSDCYQKVPKELKFVCFLALSSMEVFDQNDFHAINNNGEIMIFNPLLSVLSEKQVSPLKYGYTGVIMAHEVGHSFIKSTPNYMFVPYFPLEVEDCVKHQFKKTCDFFVNKNCFIDKIKYDEDAADIFGIQLAFQIFEKKYGDNFQEIVEGSKYNLTNQQMVYYSAASLGCQFKTKQLLANIRYHSSYERTNAQMVQSSAFQKAFKCDEQSRMIQSKYKQCHIFGNNAPLN